jgi:hypothetical protein
MTFLEFISTWDHTMEPTEWSIAVAVLIVLFAVALFK